MVDQIKNDLLEEKLRELELYYITDVNITGISILNPEKEFLRLNGEIYDVFLNLSESQIGYYKKRISDMEKVWINGFIGPWDKEKIRTKGIRALSNRPDYDNK